MKITKIYIHNFKAYRLFTLHVTESLNVLTGKNNSGKTTILEAISLWYECFRLLIMKAKRGDNSVNLRKGDYRLGFKHSNYIDYRSISSVRSYRFEDIFFNLNTSNEITISISFDDNNEEKEISFSIRGASGNNYDVRLTNHDTFDFIWLNSAFTNLPNPIGCYFASPVAAISVGEEFALDQKINKKVTARQSFLFIRNRIHRLSMKPVFQEFKDKVSYILNNNNEAIDIEVVGDILRDINIDIKLKIGLLGTAKELSLLGSGTLQIIELLLASFEDGKDHNIILLDEPDSHIHRDIQKRLIEVLKDRMLNTQIFLTTHNEGLIRSVSPDFIFNIGGNISDLEASIFKPITNEVLPNRRTGINPCYHNMVIQSLGNESSLDLLNALDADILFLVEGDDDGQYIQTIMAIFGIEKRTVFWSFRGLDTLIKKIKHYKEFLGSIGASHSIWDKAFIVVDADYMTLGQKNLLESNFSSVLQVKSHIWKAYTFEATIIGNDFSLPYAIMRHCENLGHTLSVEEIGQKLLVLKENSRQTKLQLITSDRNYCERITRQIQNRARALRADLGFTNIFIGGEAMFFQNYQQYAKTELDDIKIEHLCTKDDVEDILVGTYAELGITIDNSSVSLFDQLIQHLDVVHCPTDWALLISKINS